MLTRASQPELIRSNQKDEFYTSYLREQIGQIFRDIRGPHSWIKWKKELELFADLCYFSLTTVCGFQTLGEEYCNIVQYDSTKKTIPSTLRRACLVFLHLFGPYFLEKVLARLERSCRDAEVQVQQGRHSHWIKLLNSIIPALRQIVIVIHRTHLAVFYLTGVFYHIAKRITFIQYLLVRNSIRNISSRPSYRLLGYLSLFQLTVSLVLGLYQKSLLANTSYKGSLEGIRKVQIPGQSAKGSRLKCPLCLEQLKDMTTTPCGHLFCWYCIAEWCNSKAECPLCRENVQLARLVCLQYFEPT